MADGHPQRSHDGHEGATVLGDLAGQLAQRRARGSVGMGSGRPANQLEPARGTAQVVVEVDAKERQLPGRHVGVHSHPRIVGPPRCGGMTSHVERDEQRCAPGSVHSASCHSQYAVSPRARARGGGSAAAETRSRCGPGWMRSRRWAARTAGAGQYRTGRPRSPNRVCQVRSKVRCIGWPSTVARPPPACVIAPTRQAPATGRPLLRYAFHPVVARSSSRSVRWANQPFCTQPPRTRACAAAMNVRIWCSSASCAAARSRRARSRRSWRCCVQRDSLFCAVRGFSSSVGRRSGRHGPDYPRAPPPGIRPRRVGFARPLPSPG